MARKRMIDPGFLIDWEITTWSPWERLFYIGLWIVADDEGFFIAESKQLKNQIFPADDKVSLKQIDVMKQTVAGKNETKPKVVYTEKDGIKYGFLCNFTKYQKISHPTPSKIREILEDSRKLQKVPEKVIHSFGATPETSGQSNLISLDQSNQSNLSKSNLSQSGFADDFCTNGFKPEELKALTKTITSQLGYPPGSEASINMLKEIVTRTAQAKGVRSKLGYAIQSIKNVKAGK